MCQVIRMFIRIASMVSLMVIASACMQRPLLLRNRPNVPPPALDPDSEQIPLVASVPRVATTPELVVLQPQGVEIISAPVEIAAKPEFTVAPLTHTVQRGDSFWKIANDYGVSREELAHCNNLSLDKPLAIGTVLVIPPGGVAGYKPSRPVAAKPVAAAKPAPSKTSPAKTVSKPGPTGGTYTVVSNDSLWSIARKHNTTTNELAQANNLDPKKPIVAGMKLVIPGAASPTAAKKPETARPAQTKPEEAPAPKQPEEIDPVEDLLRDAERAAKTRTTAPVDPLSAVPPAGGPKVESPAGAPQDFFMEEILPGETLQEIAERHAITVDDLLKANPEIKPGQKLKAFTSIKIPMPRF